MDLFALTATLGLDASEFVSGIGSAKSLFSGFADTLTQGLQLAGRATWNFMKDVVDTGMEVDKQYAAVQAVLGKEEGTVENMNRLREHGLDVARDSVFTAAEVADAYYYMGLAGWKTEQQLAGLEGVIDLAAASGEDLGRVSDIVTDSITAMGLTAEDVSWYVDLLATTVTNTNTGVSQLGEAFKYVAPVAGSLGVAADDLALSLGLMANAGIKGSQAGTTLRTMFTRLANDTSGARSVLESLGTTVFDSSGQMRDWGEIITEARAGWAGLTEEQQAQYAATIAGQRGMAGFMAIMNATDEDVKSLAQNLADSADAADRMADVRLDSLEGDVVRFNSALDVLKYAIFDDVKGPMRDVVQFGTDALNRITDAINEGGLTAGIEQLGVEIEELGKTFAPMLESIGKALVPVVDSLITNLLPAIEKVGASLATGLLNGFSQGLSGSGSGTSDIIGQVLGMGGGLINSLVGGGGVFSWFFGKAEPPKVDTSKWKDTSGNEIPVEVAAEFDANAIYQSLSAALDSGSQTVEIGEGVIVATSVAQEIANAITSGALDASEDVSATLAGINTGGMESAISAAGVAGGAQAADNIQSAINGRTYSINVNASVGGLPVKENARAMMPGRIFTSPTIFGYAEGAYQVAGDAGPEAVVGVGSLDGMIQGSVNSAMVGVLSRLDAMVEKISNYSPKIVMSNGALVGAISNEMNRKLGSIASWKGGNRA